MTRNQIFGAALGGAGVLVLLSTVFSSDDQGKDYRIDFREGKRVVITDDSIEIENVGDDTLVHTKDGTINCTKNGGSVTITKSDGTTTVITCN